MNSSGLQTYPTYISNGETWFFLGSLKDVNAKLVFDATFEDIFKSFEIDVYDSESDAISGTAAGLLKSFDVPYFTALKYAISISGATTTFSFMGASGAKNYGVTTTSAPRSWEGVYFGNGVERIDNQTVDFNHIVGKAYFYPVF